MESEKPSKDTIKQQQMKKPKVFCLSVFFLLFSFTITSCLAQQNSITSKKDDNAALNGSEFDLSFLDKNRESYIDTSGNLIIADPILKTKIEQNLGLTANSKIPLSAVEAIKSLELATPNNTPEDMKIHNIDALAFFKNLERLNINFNMVKNINSLINLKNLNELCALDNRIQDISVLKELKNLEKLDLYANQVSDISILAELTQLTELNLWNNGIRNIEPLEGLTKLKVLNLGGNYIRDISPLKNCKMLITLWLHANPLINPEVISEIGANLTTLSISYCNVSDIKFLENCTKLQTLMMFGNRINDISVLRNCQSLNVMSASNNQIENIDVLAFIADKGAFQKLSKFTNSGSKTRTNIDVSNNKIDYTLEKNQKIRAYLDEKVSGVKF